MKKGQFLNILLVFSLIIALMYSCKNSDVSPDNSTIAGTYSDIVNPILCSFPTMSEVKIKASGSSYTITFKNTSTYSKEVLSDITVEKSDSTTKLFYNGSELGKFTFLKYTDYSNGNFETKEGMVLMINKTKDNKRYEFMGKK
jgi:hypothetical protein